MTEETWSAVDAARVALESGRSLHDAQQLRVHLALVLADAAADAAAEGSDVGSAIAPTLREFAKARAAHVYAGTVHEAAQAELRDARLRVARSA